MSTHAFYMHTASAPTDTSTAANNITIPVSVVADCVTGVAVSRARPAPRCSSWVVMTRQTAALMPNLNRPTRCGSRVVSVLDSGAEGTGSNRSRDAVG